MTQGMAITSLLQLTLGLLIAWSLVRKVRRLASAHGPTSPRESTR
jgi:hypothetical protein